MPSGQPPGRRRYLKNMQDIKNILLAFYSYWIPVVFAIDVSVISAIVLPIVFFAVGKAIDIGLQFYFQNRQKPER